MVAETVETREGAVTDGVYPVKFPGNRLITRGCDDCR